MKNLYVYLACMLISPFAFGQAFEQGSLSIDASYGFVARGTILNSVDQLSGQNRAGMNFDPQTFVVGPVGIRLQYMVFEKFGVGLDLNYQYKKASWNEDDYDYVVGEFDNIQATYSETKIKAMVRTSWVFINSDNFTMNWANSIGYKGGNRLIEAGDDDNVGIYTADVAPIAFRTAVGARLFITDNININAETGLFGGGWLNVGFGYKF